MEGYQELAKRHRNELENLPIFYAFSNKQFEEGMESFGLKLSETDKVYRLGNTGGFYKRSDSKEIFGCFDRHTIEMQRAIDSDKTGDGFILEMLSYELANHEYCVTYDVEPALDVFGLTMEDVEKNPALKNGLRLALKKYQ